MASCILSSKHGNIQKLFPITFQEYVFLHWPMRTGNGRYVLCHEKSPFPASWNTTFPASKSERKSKSPLAQASMHDVDSFPPTPNKKTSLRLGEMIPGEFLVNQPVISYFFWSNFKFLQSKQEKRPHPTPGFLWKPQTPPWRNVSGHLWNYDGALLHGSHGPFFGSVRELDGSKSMRNSCF